MRQNQTPSAKLSKIILICIAGFGFGYFADRVFAGGEDAGKSYFLSINYDKGVLSLDEVTVLDEKAPSASEAGSDSYTLELVSLNDEILYSRRFAIPLLKCPEKFDPGQVEMGLGCERAETANYTLKIPFYPEGAAINIIDPAGLPALFVDLSNFTVLCGDGVCQRNENYGQCPDDCKPGIRDNYCDGVSDGTCDPDCRDSRDPDCGRLANLGLVAFLVLAGIAAITVFFLLRRKPEGDDSGA